MNGDTQFGWSGAFFIILIASVLLTVPVSLLLRHLYASSIKKSMRGYAQTPLAPSGCEVVEPDAAPAPDVPTPLRIEIVEGDALPPLSGEDATLCRRAVLTPRRAALVYTLAGFVHAALATTILFRIEGIEFSPFRTILTVFILAWPVVPTIVIVAVADRRLQFIAPVLFVITLLLISGEYRVVIGLLWLEQMLIPTLAMFLIANWWLRSVGPLVLVFMSVFFCGLWFSPFIAFNLISERLGLDNAALIIVLTVCLVALFTVAALASLVSIRWRYERKWASDQSGILHLYWLLFTEWQCLFLIKKAGLGAVAGLLAYVGFSLVLWFGLRPFKRAAEARGNVKLLLLRVFGSSARSEHFLETVGLRWRYIGSIQLIAGDDLAVANLEPHEFLDFLVGQSARRFIKNSGDLERNVREIDTHPDPDGRFRINEFFCLEDTWRGALLRLVGDTDAVLMDLRGFTRCNRGVVFELTQLLNVKPSQKIVFTIDATSDLDYVREVLAAAWQRMSINSPNRRAPAEAIRLLRLERQGYRQAQQLLSMLCRAAHVS
ncbi:MAG: hypothetical protein WCD76_12490 [Pyrinomonadaceae bacterium]